MNLKQKLLESFDDDNRAYSVYKILLANGDIKVPVTTQPKPDNTISIAGLLRRQA